MSQLSRAGHSLVGIAAFSLILTACSPGFSAAVDPVGVWSESDDDGAPTLTLHDDGTLTGFDGCNQLSGGWEPTDDGVNFKQLVSTDMACEDVDAWLQLGESASINYDTMIVLDPDGRSIGTLERTGETPD